MHRVLTFLADLFGALAFIGLGYVVCVFPTI